MTSHLPDDKLCHQIGVGMEICLSKKGSSEKLNKNKIVDFHKWLNEVKRCDDVLRPEREEYECIAKENRDMSRRGNYASEPSFCRAPSNNNNSSQTVPSASTMNTPTTCKQCFELLDSKRKFLNENEGCLKCRCFFVEYPAVNCPNDFPNPATYKSLTQSDADCVKHGCEKPIASVGFSNAPSTSATTVSPSDQMSHPVAAVLGMSHNPTAYIVPNTSSMIGSLDVDDSDSSD